MPDRIDMQRVWMALGGDPRDFETWINDPGRTRADAWAQLLAAIRGDIPALMRDTNPPTGELLAIVEARTSPTDWQNDRPAVRVEWGRQAIDHSDQTVYPWHFGDGKTTPHPSTFDEPPPLNRTNPIPLRWVRRTVTTTAWHPADPRADAGT